MKRIFISRQLSPNSPIRKVAYNHEIVDQSLISFTPLPFDPPTTDWIFFYSRNGVKYFFEQGQYHLFPYLWACISEGTADELSKYVTDSCFVGKGSPQEIALSFDEVRTASETVTFIRANNSVDSIYKTIGKVADVSLPVYQNESVDNLPYGEFDILIFTSPLNVRTWLSKRTYQNEKIIVIGNTTAKAIREESIDQFLIAETPSEEAISLLLKDLL